MASEETLTARRGYHRAYSLTYKRRPKPPKYDCRKGVHRLVRVDEQPGLIVYQCQVCAVTQTIERGRRVA